MGQGGLHATQYKRLETILQLMQYASEPLRSPIPKLFRDHCNAPPLHLGQPRPPRQTILPLTRIPGASPSITDYSNMDASTPRKRSTTDAGLDSPREANRSDARAAPKISKARACESEVSPTYHRMANLRSQVQNVSATRFGVNFDPARRLAPNARAVESSV